MQEKIAYWVAEVSSPRPGQYRSLNTVSLTGFKLVVRLGPPRGREAPLSANVWPDILADRRH